MKPYNKLGKSELESEYNQLKQQYEAICAKGLALNMARGKPSAAQLDLSMPMLSMLQNATDCLAEDGTDCRNYGVLEGLPEARKLMATILDDEPENTIVFGNASLTIMHDTIWRLWTFGAPDGQPWCKLPKVKWLCPAPGYDRHFAITQAFDIEMIPVEMTECGPNMEQVEQLVSEDAYVKGIWCVPKYSNPTGITYSSDVVRRLATMKCAASDFRIFWDNAYSVHHLYSCESKQDTLADIYKACCSAGNPQRSLKFASTSKITFPGAGISAMAASPKNMAWVKQHMAAQIISHDKLNQLRHVRFLGTGEKLKSHMAKHAEILQPKFALVDKMLSEQLNSVGSCAWTKPRGGYFVSFNTPEGCAKRTVKLCKQAGVVLTGAGATYPCGNDQTNSNIRIAPSMPPLNELESALNVFCCCVKLAYAEKLLEH